jgi:hypothetical protein
MTQPSQVSSPQLNAAVASIAESATTQLDPVWSLPPNQIIPALFDTLPDVVDTWGLAAASAAADWYDHLRDTENVSGRFTAIVEPLGDLGAQALAGWVAQPLNEPEPDLLSAQSRLADGLQKRIVNSANETVTGSAKADPQAKGYMRRTRPGACKFCIMVASRGSVFTEKSARFACHGHCYCEAVPAWGGRPLPVHPYKPSRHESTPEERARVRKWIADNL